MTKVFEGEVGDALRRLSPGYVHKCPDHPHAIPDKVDFLGVYRAIGFGIEAKEVRQRDRAPATILTPNQRRCLEAIYRADGFAAVVINFDRQRGVSGRVGFCFGYKFIDLPEEDGHFEADRGVLIPRVAGGWAVDEWIRRTM